VADTSRISSYDRSGEEAGGRAVYVTDPDGNVVEFWTYDVSGDRAEVAGV